MSRSLIVFSILCLFVFTPPAGAAVWFQDLSDGPLVATTDVSWGAAWEVEKEYLSVETISGQPWSTVLFEVLGSKSNFSTPYGSGTTFLGWICTQISETVVEPNPTFDWMQEVIRFTGGETIDHHRMFDAVDVGEPDMFAALRRLERHPLRGDRVSQVIGGFVNDSLNPSPVSGYLGFALTSPWDEVHYGWMEIQTYIDNSKVELKVLGWGVEQVPGRAIVAGHHGPARVEFSPGQQVEIVIDDSQLAVMADGMLFIEANPGYSALLRSVTMLDEGNEAYAFLRALGDVAFLADFDLTLEPGESVRLMIDIGEGIEDEIEVWYFSGTHQEKLGADQWLYRNGHLIIPEAGSFSSYGIVVIPEPAGLLLPALAGLLLRRRRN
ncbi:MAG: hypothetical protein JJU36_09065 [Phycisphaeraceae bacterium]|nr:hypothetical protein [Phycisphaeraceae bacterium]